MSTFEERLKEERKRLGLNQDEFAALGGVKKGAQFNYENGSRKPDSAYLESLAKEGINILYLITGQTSVAQLDKDEENLVSNYRKLDARGKKGVLALIDGVSPAEKITANYRGDIGQVVHGKQTVNAPMTLSIKAPKKKAVK